MSERIFNAAFAAYMLIAIVTFGHAYHWFGQEMPAGKRPSALVPAIVSSAAWPIYVSVRLWEPKP
jgi:hypothetical protein